MPDDLSEFLRRGAGAARPAWGFDEVWRRARRQRVRNSALMALSAAAIVGAIGISGFLLTEIDERGSRVAPAQKGRGESGATWEGIPAAPIEARAGNLAVWTGVEMIVWGGADDAENPAGFLDGAAFDPASGDWRSIADGPLSYSGGRSGVWTGEEMLVWGGEVGDGSHGRPDNGAAYHPRTDTWVELPPSPSWSLAGHSAIWTGNEMVVWGGVGMEDRGAAFDPGSATWRTIAPAPIDGRFRHAAVWTGTEMIVWGGRAEGGALRASGAAYDPRADSWRELARPSLAGRDGPAGVWTGEEMIVWGGWTNAGTRFDGAAYDPASDSWRDLPRAPVSAGLPQSPVAWTGREMVAVGVGDGSGFAAYIPAKDDWIALPEPPMGEVRGPSVVSADGQVILWGGWLQPTSGNEAALSNEGAILRLIGQ